MLELSGNVARDAKKKRVNPRHLLLAMRNDEELKILLGAVTIPQGGVIPSYFYRSRCQACWRMAKMARLEAKKAQQAEKMNKK